MAGWRDRLDLTSNWAITVVAAMLSVSLSTATAHHGVLLFAMLLVLLLLTIEARRYRFFDVYRSRVRQMERNYFGQIFEAKHEPGTVAYSRETQLKLLQETTDEMAREGEARALTAQPVYRFSPTAYDSALAAARDFFSDLERASAQGPELTQAVAASQAHLGPEEIRYLADPARRRAMRELVTHSLGETLSRGVADAGVIRGEVSRQITLRRNDSERVVARDSILTFADLMEQAEAAVRGAKKPHTTSTMMAPTTAPIRPAPWPAWYQPSAWPR